MYSYFFICPHKGCDCVTETLHPFGLEACEHGHPVILRGLLVPLWHIAVAVPEYPIIIENNDPLVWHSPSTRKQRNVDTLKAFGAVYDQT